MSMNCEIFHFPIGNGFLEAFQVHISRVSRIHIMEQLEWALYPTW